MAEKKRIVYIDYLKGLTVLWVVWYHTVHPEFVDFSFRIPLFFFVSGIFFKPYELKTFIKKKVNTLVVPFLFFYLLYYLYLIALWSANNPVSSFNFGCIWGVFGLYHATQSFTVNPPLWFICALITLQFMLYALKCTRLSNIYIWLISVAVSLLGTFWLYYIDTPFMISRSLPYFIYYCTGYVFGNKMLSYIEGENGKKASVYLGLSGLLLFMVCWQLKLFVIDNDFTVIITYLETFSLILFFVYLLKYSYRLPFMKFLGFYGKNSYVVLGMHKMILTTLLLFYLRLRGEPDIMGGIVLLVLTTVILWPTILILNKFCPRIIGKNELWK